MIDHLGLDGPARALIERRVRSAIYDGPQPCDERMIERMVDILMIDVRRAGGGELALRQTIDADDRSIAALATVVTDEATARFVSSELPNGTILELRSSGIFLLGDERWVADFVGGGLEPYETASRAVGGAKFFRLLELIDEQVEGRPWAMLGHPKPATFYYHGLTDALRFAPFALAGGMWLQINLEDQGFPVFSTASDADLRAMAATTSSAMEDIWRDRAHFARWAKALKERAGAVCGDSGMKFVGVGIDLARFPDDEGDYEFSVEFIGTGDDLRRGRIFDTVWNTELSHTYYSSYYIRREAERNELRDTLAALGAHGRIDDVAASLIQVAAEGPAALLRRMSIEQEVHFALPGERSPVWATLKWRQGTIHADFRQTVDIFYDALRFSRAGIDHTCGTLRLPTRPFGDILDSAMVGKPVQEILRPSFPVPGVVKSIKRNEGYLELAVTARSSLVNLDTGAIW